MRSCTRRGKLVGFAIQLTRGSWLPPRGLQSARVASLALVFLGCLSQHRFREMLTIQQGWLGFCVPDDIRSAIAGVRKCSEVRETTCAQKLRSYPGSAPKAHCGGRVLHTAS